MAVMADYQAQYGTLILGNDHYDITSFDGLTMPDVRTSDVDRPQFDGQYAGVDYLRGRTFTISLDLWHDRDGQGAAGEQFGARLREIQSAFTPGRTDTFIIQIPGLGQITTECRVRRRHGPIIDLEAALGRAKLVVEFHATDPRWYSTRVQTGTATTRISSGGLTFPVSFSATFGERETGGSLISARNDGTHETFPIIVINGPVSSPQLVNVATARALKFPGLEVLSGQILVVDFVNRTALLNRTSSRYSFIEDSSQWWSLAPGVNEIRFLGSSRGNPTAKMTWRSAYI